MAMAEADDPHKWLEEVLGDEPLAWVKSKNDEVIATEVIDFKAHWRPKLVRYNLTVTAGAFDDTASYSLMLRDAWGFENRTIALSC